MSNTEDKTIPTEEKKVPKELKIDTKKKKKKTKPTKLENTWKFWHEKYQPTTNWTIDSHLQNLKEATTEFNTIQDFWSCFNSLPKIDNFLNTKDCFHLMRVVNKDGIKPIWEDPENANGGEWTFKVDRKEGEKVWEDLVLACIGEQFSEILDDDDEICGVSVSARPQDFVFMVWNKNAKSPKRDLILEKIKQLLNVELRTSFYKEHKQHQ